MKNDFFGQAKQSEEIGLGGGDKSISLNNQTWRTVIKYEVSYKEATGSNRIF